MKVPGALAPADAVPLVEAARVRVVDVRPVQEYEAAGHIASAASLPLERATAGPAVLPLAGPPLLVCGASDADAAEAAALLARAGFPGVRRLAGGMGGWPGPLSHAPARPLGPATWLVEHRGLLPPAGLALDVACGRGRHALWLAARGLRVRAVDRDAEAVAALQEAAARLGLGIDAEVADLEAGGAQLGDGVHDVVVVVHYLHRPLFPSLIRCLAPGGLLVYETFTVEQARRGRPRRPEFLLAPGELQERAAPLRLLRAREGEAEGRAVASIVARKDPASA